MRGRDQRLRAACSDAPVSGSSALSDSIAGATFVPAPRLLGMSQRIGQPHPGPLADVGTATLAIGHASAAS